jgi:hypothetical protein
MFPPHRAFPDYPSWYFSLVFLHGTHAWHVIDNTYVELMKIFILFLIQRFNPGHNVNPQWMTNKKKTRKPCALE